MQLDVIASINEARSDDFVHKTVAVIDVLRATSVMATALVNGCEAIVPVETVQQAKQYSDAGVLLGGERFCKKIPGFDLGNSPLEYTPEAVAGKKVVMTTTNGTRALQKSHKASFILAASMLNAHACAKASLQLKRDIVILCAGTLDVFSLEDGLCAGLLVAELLKLSEEPVELNDFASAMLGAYRDAEHRLEEALMNCANGKRLCRLGFAEDVKYCAAVNRLDIVPIMNGNTLRRFS